MERVSFDDYHLHHNSIESSGNNSKSNTSIDIPAAVDKLIDNKAYRPKFRKLLREYRTEVMALVEIAHTKTKPSHWFATVTAKQNWERTLEWLQRLFSVRELAERVAGKLRTTVSRFIYQQIWREVNVERWADTAAEVGRHKAKYFAWLCKREAVLRTQPVYSASNQ